MFHKHNGMYSITFKKSNYSGVSLYTHMCISSYALGKVPDNKEVISLQNCGFSVWNLLHVALYCEDVLDNEVPLSLAPNKNELLYLQMLYKIHLANILLHS